MKIRIPVGRRKSSVQRSRLETVLLLALVSTTQCVAPTGKCLATLAFFGRLLAPVGRRSQYSMKTRPVDGQMSRSMAEYATGPRCPVPNPARTLGCPCVPPIGKPTIMPVWLSWKHAITTPACLWCMKGTAGPTSCARTGSPGWEGSKCVTASLTALVVGKTRRRTAWGSCRPSAGTPAPRCSCTIRHRLPTYLSPQVHAPVCGDDGYTYRSLCLLEQTACQQGKNITAVYAGQCRLQSNSSSSWEEGQAHYDDYSEDDQILCPTNCNTVGFFSPSSFFHPDVRPCVWHGQCHLQQ